jgi:anti-anti-sigma factor
METIIKKDEGLTTLSIKGRLMTDKAAEFMKDIEPLLKESNANILVDMGGLEFISSAGIRCFVMLLKACQANGSRLRLKNLTPQIKNIFSLTALLDKFEIE